MHRADLQGMVTVSASLSDEIESQRLERAERAEVMFVASMPVVGYLAYERGRSQRRWIYIATVIGPLAIPMLYFVAAISTLRKMINRPRP
jgi:hypothetical protein